MTGKLYTKRRLSAAAHLDIYCAWSQRKLSLRHTMTKTFYRREIWESTSMYIYNCSTYVFKLSFSSSTYINTIFPSSRTINQAIVKSRLSRIRVRQCRFVVANTIAYTKSKVSPPPQQYTYTDLWKTITNQINVTYTPIHTSPHFLA